MKVVIPGGPGQVGGVLRRALPRDGHDVVVLSRDVAHLEAGVRHAIWDGRSLGGWAQVDLRVPSGKLPWERAILTRPA